MKQIILSIMLLWSLSACSQGNGPLPKAKHKSVVYKNEYFISESHYDYSEITNRIIGQSQSEYDIARSIYLWLCKNIEYDKTGLIRTADEAWDKRQAVCQGYCELFFRMAETKGLKTTLIYGKAKSMQPNAAPIDHVWISVKTTDGNILMDPTWGSGHYVNGSFMHTSDPLLWFDVEPEWLIFTHFPTKEKYQYLKPAYEEEQFRAFPFVTPSLKVLGLSGSDALEMVNEGKGSFPRMPSQHQEVQIVKAPWQNLTAGSTYHLTFKRMQGCKLVAVTGTKTIEEGKRYNGEGFNVDAEGIAELTITPSAGRLVIYFVHNNDPMQNRTLIIAYQVKSK